MMEPTAHHVAAAAPTPDEVLRVEDLFVQFSSGGKRVHAVDGVSFSLKRGEVFGLVGESGCGKSATLRSIIGLLPGSNVGKAGRIEYDGRNLLMVSDATLRRVRGAHISMIFQDPMTYLNPVLRIDEQIQEALRQHTTLNRRERRDRAIELMRLVGVPLPERRLREYPHQFSGGMRQRVLIAIALACNPKILLADEPTTALDVTIQDQILKLLLQLRDELGMSIVLVSHDLGVIVQTCERVAVMYAGQIVETATTRELIRRPKHPYTVGLLNSLPSIDSDSRYLQPIPGSPPSLTDVPPGCRFYDRCSLRTDECRTWRTELLPVSDRHTARCLHHDQVERAHD
jgi:peptide/nickel transport system ATP-binding protein/oligopeptide transport system ATP-binding protein